MNDLPKLFLDTEFTGLHKNTTLISLALVCGESSFYAEFNDYDKSQVDLWVQDNVIDKLTISVPWHTHNFCCHDKSTNSIQKRGTKAEVRAKLEEWLESLPGEKYEVWSDCLAYDWVLFCDLWGHAFGVPDKIYPYPFDIVTLFKMNSIDPDISRDEFAGFTVGSSKHHALWDAKIIQECYKRLLTAPSDFMLLVKSFMERSIAKSQSEKGVFLNEEEMPFDCEPEGIYYDYETDSLISEKVLPDEPNSQEPAMKIARYEP